METKLIIERSFCRCNIYNYINSYHKLQKQVKNTHKSFQFHVILTDVQKTLHESN